jgi:hypothetical protein
MRIGGNSRSLLPRLRVLGRRDEAGRLDVGNTAVLAKLKIIHMSSKINFHFLYQNHLNIYQAKIIVEQIVCAPTDEQ